MISRASVDIDSNVATYLGSWVDTARYSSFDYCFNYFRGFHDAGDVAALAMPTTSRSHACSSASTWRAGECSAGRPTC